MSMRVLVTRPEPDNARTAAKLLARGCEVMLAPLLQIEPVEPGRVDLSGAWDALAVSSGNAVRALAAHPRLAGLLAIPLYAVGSRTADAAFALGFDNVISADGDAQDLVRVMKTHFRSGARILYLAGEERSADFAGALAASRIAVETRVVYRAAQVQQYPPDVRDALAAGRLDGVLHFSRRTAGAYVACAAAAGISDRALEPVQYCLSRQVAEPLAAAGAGRLTVAREPTEDALIGLVQAP
jgi:uroporphyrinogen-III synthase